MTPLFQPVPSIMLVGLDTELAAACEHAFPSLLVLRVGHGAAAVERMLVTRPLVVVVGENLARSEVALVTECARDIQAEVLRGTNASRAEFPEYVRLALLVAERNRERPTAPP
jgi:hypothetical protein